MSEIAARAAPDQVRGWVPPGAVPAQRSLGVWQLARTAKVNALEMWPEEAYATDVLVQAGMGRSRYLLNSEDAIHRVLVGNAKNYRRTPASIRILRPVAGDGLLLSEGTAWRRQRQTIAPALAPRVIPILASHVVAETARLATSLPEGEINALETLQRLTLEIAGRSMFSIEMETHGPKLRRMLTQYGLQLGRPTLLDYLLPVSIPSPRDLWRMAFRRRWVRFMDGIVAERSRAPASERPRDLFDLLVAARDPETGEAFTPAQLRDQTATLILAGHETTALTLFWALILVAGAPDVQDRLADEVRTLDPVAEAARPGLPSLPYTRAVIQEAMRLYPPAFTLAREAIAADRVGDVAIAAGSVILIAPWVLHRHRRFWREPGAFDPSRFEGDTAPAHRFAYLPFGAGPRVCVGAQFAMTEAILALAMLVQVFEVAVASDRPVLPVAVITTQPDHEARLRLRRRVSSPSGPAGAA